MGGSGRHIGLYIDDRGLASPSRAAALLRHLDAHVTLLTALPVDALPRTSEAPVVPLSGSVEQRIRTVRQWWEQDQPELLVVDGNTALAAGIHVAGIPTVAVRPLGAPWPLDDGDPLPTIAPYPEELEAPPVPAAVRSRTTYVGAFSYLDGVELDQERSRSALGLTDDRPVVTIVAAGGLGRPAEQRLLRAAAATRGWQWLVAGDFGSTEGVVPDNLRPLGWRPDLGDVLSAADVVVSVGSHTTTEDVASVRRPHLVLQEPGTSDERHAAVAQLVRAGIATVMPIWPDAENWPGLLRDIARIDTAPQRGYCDHHGARRLADHLHRLTRDTAGKPTSAA